MKERVQWEQAAVFEVEDLSVKVMKLPLKWPKYALMIGSSYEDRQGVRKQGARINVRVNQGSVKTPDEVLLKLVGDAREWIENDVRLLGPPPGRRGKPKDDGQRRQPTGPLLGLKELKKRDKAAWEARQAEKAEAEKADDGGDQEAQV